MSGNIYKSTVQIVIKSYISAMGDESSEKPPFPTKKRRSRRSFGLQNVLKRLPFPLSPYNSICPSQLAVLFPLFGGKKFSLWVSKCLWYPSRDTFQNSVLSQKSTTENTHYYVLRHAVRSWEPNTQGGSLLFRITSPF